MSDHLSEIKRRRTFAIISHPDAGKTTLTEKLLLFGGAIQQAGAIKAKKAQKHTASDWMELEKQRGVSVATSVMSFEYDGMIINLLDTPGHVDFSEDTYRTLTAVDSVLMVIDSVKGVEERTKKLMDVCQMRKIPVITFINKLDREGLDPFALLDDIENNLAITAVPLSWPLGMGRGFRGVYNLRQKSYLQFTDKQKFAESQNIEPQNIPAVEAQQRVELADAVATIRGALEPFSLEKYLRGEMTPVFFGSALNNFGILDLLREIIRLAPPPLPRPAAERIVDPTEDKMTGIVFKIHANMDPRHRDRIAFLRVCSGVFRRGMQVYQVREKREFKVANPLTFLAQARAVTEEAYPGDIIGIHDTGALKIGDTFSEGEELNFSGIPSFAPEIFRLVINRNPLKAKQLQKGLRQLSEEGAVQLFKGLLDQKLVLGAVGELQFDVVRFRLENEYGAQCEYQNYEAAFAYWVSAAEEKYLKEFQADKPLRVMQDIDGQLVFLFKGAWEIKFIHERFPEIRFYKTSECRARDLAF
ncbi:MAG: peptide chain release factor 3 [Candidatus Margulisbacteria bacterium]|jgi:peptide chain release factor 3|nr:peptide chain release factor 3 [Candidatus Margulisiibacteriota bacterium]